MRLTPQPPVGLNEPVAPPAPTAELWPRPFCFPSPIRFDVGLATAKRTILMAVVVLETAGVACCAPAKPLAAYTLSARLSEVARAAAVSGARFVGLVWTSAKPSVVFGTVYVTSNKPFSTTAVSVGLVGRIRAVAKHQPVHAEAAVGWTAVVIVAVVNDAGSALRPEPAALAVRQHRRF